MACLLSRAPAEMNLKVMQYLFDDESLRFRFLTDLTAVHYPERKDEEICVVYHLHNLVDNIRMRFKVYVPDSQARCVYRYATVLWQLTGWSERRMTSLV